MAGVVRAAATISGLSHRYGSTLAIDSVSVRIPGGQITGLIGPDGVGKSSLLGLLAGAKRIQSDPTASTICCSVAGLDKCGALWQTPPTEPKPL